MFNVVDNIKNVYALCVCLSVVGITQQLLKSVEPTPHSRLSRFYSSIFERRVWLVICRMSPVVDYRINTGFWKWKKMILGRDVDGVSDAVVFFLKIRSSHPLQYLVIMVSY